MRNILLILVSVAILASCSTQKGVTRAKTYSQIYEEKPVSILVLPPINRSVKVEAKELFYSSMAAPISQFGYYVFPPLLTMEILKEESAYDSELFLDASMKRVGEAFGADAVLFTIIHDWRKTAIAAQMSVKVEYILKSTRTDAVLFSRVGDVNISFVEGSGSALGMLISTVLNTVMTKEIVGGRACNYYTLSDLPRGKYHPFYGKDSEIIAQPKEFNGSLSVQQAQSAANASASAVR